MKEAAFVPGNGLIVVVVKGYPRLSETFIAEELLGLEQSGLRLLIVSMRHPTDPTSHPVHKAIRSPVVYLPEYLYHAPLRVLRGVIRSSRRPGFGKALRTWLGDLTRDFSPNRFRRFGQAAVLSAEMPADASWLYAHFIHTPSAVTRYASLMTGLDWSCSAHAKDIWTSPDWELRDNLASAKWAVTCTQVGHERLTSLAPDPQHVRLVYHGLNLERFTLNRHQPSRRDGSNPAEPVRLLTVGRAVEKKGFTYLLDALAALPTDVHWTLTHIGGGELLKSLKAKAAAQGIADRIRWLGPQDQATVLANYRESDIFVLPCRVADNGDRDGLPNVLVEAQSQGLACVSTSVGGVPELIRDGETGLLVPPEDSCALGQTLERMIRYPDLRQRLAQAGEQRTRSTFDKRAGVAQLVELFATSLDAETEDGVVREAAQ